MFFFFFFFYSHFLQPFIPERKLKTKFCEEYTSQSLTNINVTDCMNMPAGFR